MGWMGRVAEGAPARIRAAASTNVCIDGAVDWYTESMGESPCATYERLRQQCNPGYQTPVMSQGTIPPDHCDDQRQHCCCNSLAFGLAMLCMNCQLGNGSTVDNGIDAGVGAYSAYGAGCNIPQTAALPSNLDHFICSSQPSIPQYLVDTSFYPTGQWFYNITMTEGSQDIAVGANAAACNSLSTDGFIAASAAGAASVATAVVSSTANAPSGTGISSPSSSTGFSATSPSSSASTADTTSVKTHISAGAVAGGVVGGLAVLVALVIAVFLYRLRSKRGRIFSPKGSEPVHGDEFRSTPFTYSRPGSAVPPVTTEVNRLSITSVGPSVEPTRTDFSQSPPSSPPPIPHATFASQVRQPQPQLASSSAAAAVLSRGDDRLDLTAGEAPPRRLTPSEQRDSYRNPGSTLYPFWGTSSKHTSSTSAPSEAGDEGERIRDSVLRSFNPRGMVRQSPPKSPRAGGSPGGGYVVNR